MDPDGGEGVGQHASGRPLPKEAGGLCQDRFHLLSDLLQRGCRIGVTVILAEIFNAGRVIHGKTDGTSRRFTRSHRTASVRDCGHEYRKE
ncbi:MAG: hypothetical protein E5W35_33215 [Mesorhizobium sp.]|nr:MAG: hypothetical protein E5W35_33215 [Mesorhizobium sp.]TIW77381.1 MAG: hypothetical protein E5V53_25730 [Mesorhizobium sp.]